MTDQTRGIKRPYSYFLGNVDSLSNINEYEKSMYRGKKSRLMDPIEIKDDYYWMYDKTRKDEFLLKLLDDENKKVNQFSDQVKDLENEIYDKMKSQINENEESYPTQFSNTDVYTYIRYIDGKGFPIYCYKLNPDHLDNIDKIDSINENIMLDVNEFNDNNIDVISVKFSYNLKYISYSIDRIGNEEYDIVILENGNEIYRIKNILYGSYLWKDNDIYYVKQNDKNVMCKLYRENILTGEKKLIYEEEDHEYAINIYYSDSEKYIFMKIFSTEHHETYYIENDDINLLFKRGNKICLIDDFDDDKFIMFSNHEHINFNLYTMSKKTLEIKELFEYEPNRYITDVSVFNNHIVISVKMDGVNTLGVLRKDKIDYTKKMEYEFIDWIKYGTELFSIELTYHNENYNKEDIIISCESLTNPHTLLKYDMNSKNIIMIKQKKYPNYDPTKYSSKMIYVKSHDDKDIPVVMCYKNDIDLSKKNPTFLYGYGAYGIGYEITLNMKNIPLLDHGFVVCLAYIRGGSEKGHSWYLDGKIKNKMNTFKDFISVSEYLRNNYSSSLAIEGRSAGGLLMGAVITMRPDLYDCVHLGVPFVDVICTMRDSNIPLTIGEWTEWGNSNYKDDYEYMIQYSPMDNIKKTYYPPTLITSGLHDPRVSYHEPTKFHFKLLDNKQDDNVHLLKTEMHKGHFANSNRYHAIKERAFQLAFFMNFARK